MKNVKVKRGQKWKTQTIKNQQGRQCVRSAPRGTTNMRKWQSLVVVRATLRPLVRTLPSPLIRWDWCQLCVIRKVTDLILCLFEMEQPPVALKVEEELSELELRFLALQSASKIWHQKEQQVMKRSKDRITKVTQERNTSTLAAAPSRRITTRSISSSSSTPTSTPAAERSKTRSKTLERDRTKTTTRSSDRERPKGSSKGLQERSRTPAKPHLVKKFAPGKTKIISGSTGAKDWCRRNIQGNHLASCEHHVMKRWLLFSGSATKQAVRKQQLRTWKLQQQREQEDDRRQEEEERRKREEEIRRIRDLSNQDEQYNRFMKLVGGKTRTSSRVRARQLH